MPKSPRNPARKIAIIGCAGSGKTTLAFRLAQLTELPLYHLDQYYWKPGWQREEWEQFQKIHDELCQRPEWIIEGPYTKLLQNRLEHADVIVYLDIPRTQCLLRVIRRAWTHRGESIPGSPKDCPQRIMSRGFFDFLLWIWNFKSRNHDFIMHLLHEHPSQPTVYVVSNDQEIEKLLHDIT